MFLKAGAIFVTGLTGLESAFQLNLVMTVMLAMVLAYTMLGGMLSVVFTDYLQFVLLSIGLLLTSVLAIRALGWEHITSTTVDLKGIAGVDPFHPNGGGAEPGEGGVGYVVWMAFVGVISAAVWQTAVMRACSAESTAVVKRLYVISSIGFLIRFLVPYFLGICAFVYVAGDAGLEAIYLAPGADSVTSLKAMPVVLGRLLPTGLLGIVAAGMLAAFMSTHDSYLLCWSSVLTQDVVAPLYQDRLSTRARLILTRSLIFVIGVFLLVWSLWYPLKAHLWDYMAVTGGIYFTGAFVILAFGIYWRRASTAGAYAALATGFLVILGLGPVKEFVFTGIGLGNPPSHFIGLAAVGAAIVAMVAFSLLRPDPERPGRETETL